VVPQTLLLTYTSATGKAWLAMLLQRRLPQCSRLSSSQTSTAMWKSLAGNVVEKAPSTVLQALNLTHLHSNVEKLGWQCCCKGAFHSAQGSQPHRPPQHGKSLADNVVVKALSAVLQALHPSPPHRPPQQRGKALLSMLLQRRPPQHSRLSTSQTSTAMGKSLSGNVVVMVLHI
jgi:hypothetical protein